MYGNYEDMLRSTNNIGFLQICECFRFGMLWRMEEVAFLIDFPKSGNIKNHL